MQAEAKGQQAILDGKAAGYKSLVAACAQEPSLTAGFLLIEKLVDVARIQTEAVKNLPIEKIIVWDGGGEGGMQNLGQRIMGTLPPMHELAKMSGLELPEFLGRITPKKEGGSKESPSAQQEKKS
jgi:flotillin